KDFLIAAADDIEMIAIGPVIRALTREGPRITLRTIRPPLAVTPPDDVLRRGEADLALGLFPATLRPRHDLSSGVVLRERFVAIVRVRHPRVGSRLSRKDFLAIPQVRIVYPREVRMGSVDTVLAALGHERRVALTVANIASVPAIVATSDLLGVVPE